MQLKVLLQFFEEQLDIPSQLVQMGNFFSADFKIIGDELVQPSFTVLVTYLSEA